MNNNPDENEPTIFDAAHADLYRQLVRYVEELEADRISRRIAALQSATPDVVQILLSDIERVNGPVPEHQFSDWWGSLDETTRSSFLQAMNLGLEGIIEMEVESHGATVLSYLRGKLS